MKVEIEVPDLVFDEVSLVLNKVWGNKVTPQELKATRSDVVMALVKRDVEWWLADCFGDGLADSLDDGDLEALGVSELNNKEY